MRSGASGTVVAIRAERRGGAAHFGNCACSVVTFAAGLSYHTNVGHPKPLIVGGLRVRKLFHVEQFESGAKPREVGLCGTAFLTSSAPCEGRC
jgi:hypothetical protein